LARSLRGRTSSSRPSPCRAAHPDLFEVDTAAAHYRQALALAEELGLRPLVAHCHLGLGKLNRRTGKREQAREHLTTATTMYGEIGVPFWLQQADAEMQELY
jgi:Tetratricopeptide repeat